MGLENRIPRLPGGYYFTLGYVVDDYGYIWYRLKLLRKRKYWFPKKLRHYLLETEHETEQMIDELVTLIRNPKLA